MGPVVAEEPAQARRAWLGTSLHREATVSGLGVSGPGIGMLPPREVLS